MVNIDLDNDLVWLGASKQQGIAWANFDPDLFRHMAPLGYSE